MEDRAPAGYARLIMSADDDTTRSAADDAAAAPLDLLLGDAATGMLRRMNPGGSGLRLAAALAAKPRLVAGRGGQLAGELARIAVGRSQTQPSRRDRRFADPGWTGNPLLRRTMQAYLATAESVEGVVAEAGLNERDSERVGFVLTNLIDALAPSNNPLLNPAAVKAALDTGGGSAVAGLRHFLSDMAVPPRVPTMVEPDAFEVGVDLAVTPGSVVLRTPQFELIQYRPVSPAVRQVPLLIVPPVINKFYVMDLAPRRSMVEYLVGQGLQVFMISWRNPDARYAKWDINTYGQAILDAIGSAAGRHPVRHAGHRRIPGAGGPLPSGHPAVAAERAARPARLRAGRRAGHLLGRRARAAVRREPPGPGAPPGAGGDRARRADGARASARPAAHAHAAAPPGPRARGPHRR